MKVKLGVVMAVLLAFMCSQVYAAEPGWVIKLKRDVQEMKQAQEEMLQPQQNVAPRLDPTGRYTGKYVMDSDRGEGWILINHYTNDLLSYSLNIDAADGQLSIHNGTLKLVGNTTVGVVGESGKQTIRTGSMGGYPGSSAEPVKMNFVERVGKDGKRITTIELSYQGRHLGVFIKTKSKSTELGKD